MKKMIAGITCAALFLVTSLVLIPTTAVAQDDGGSQEITQAEFARLLVRVMGLGKYVAPGAGQDQYYQVLAQNGIFPKDNWDSDANLDKGVLARLMVQALGLAGEVEDIDDYQACIAKLQELNISVAASTGALAKIRSRNRFAETTTNTIGAQVDPILRHDMRAFNPEDEPTGGADQGGAVAPLGGNLYVVGRPVTVKEVTEVITKLPFKSRTAKKVQRPVTPLDVRR
ncbi:MAG: hypothetical protein ACOX52_04055 [Verrucomicrobiota bacterium]|jgi:hypothetical protein|nr:hypothetical protein [Verrucomicrobiota bacterium]